MEFEGFDLKHFLGKKKTTEGNKLRPYWGISVNKES